MLQMGENEDEEKPKFASLMPNQSIETINLEEALQMFKLPRVIGQDEEGKDVKTNVGRFGPYVQIDKTYASITHDQIFGLFVFWNFSIRLSVCNIRTVATN